MKPIRSVSIRNILVLSLFMAACQPVASQTNGLPRVLAAETFLQDMAQNVAGDRLKVDSLLPPTIDPHEYQPIPLDAIRLAKAQVIIVNGLGYESWLQKTLDSLGGSRQLIVATKGLAPARRNSSAAPVDDPHMWMDPLNVISYVEQIRDGLSQADPGGKDLYDSNARGYIAKLQELDDWVKSEVSQIPPDRRLLVTNHDALGYFARAYGFTVVGAVIPSVTVDASPSGRQIIDLIQAIDHSGARAIFLDLGENQELAEQISSETRVKIVTDLYVESLSGPAGPVPTYIDLIKYDTTLIVNALK